jgi:hypothetical protein
MTKQESDRIFRICAVMGFTVVRTTSILEIRYTDSHGFFTSELFNIVPDPLPPPPTPPSTSITPHPLAAAPIISGAPVPQSGSTHPYTWTQSLSRNATSAPKMTGLSARLPNGDEDLTPVATVYECGSEKSGSNRHSTWCMKYTA